MKLSAKIQLLIEGYKEANKMYVDKMESVIEQFKDDYSKYKPEYVKEALLKYIQSANEEIMGLNKVYNQKLKSHIAESKEEILPYFVEETYKPSSYEMQIMNALTFLEAEGEDITDEVAHSILKPFENDHDQMRLFKRIIEKAVKKSGRLMEDSSGNTTFPKTFGKLHAVIEVLDLFNNMEAIAENLFLYKKISAKTIHLNNHSYSIPMDSFSQVQDETDIMNLALKVDEIEEQVTPIDAVE